MEMPCLCPSEGHKHGGLKVTETSVTEFATTTSAPAPSVNTA